jgi:hypothetical protein
MTRHLILGALVFSSLTLAQPRPNRIEKAKDKQDLRQDRRQLTNDRMDAARAAQMLRDYDAAVVGNDAVKLGAIDVAFNAHLAGEIAESQVESAQARQEVREDKREVGGDSREIRRDVVIGKGVAVTEDDARDRKRDKANLADDRKDAARERLSRERLLAIQAQLGGLAGRFDPPSVAQKRQLYAEVVANAVSEIHRDKQETREDKRELREDKRERREDRRQR